MLYRKRFLEIISGRQRGLISSLVRLGLGGLTPLYRAAIAVRNFRFDRAIRQLDLSLSRSKKNFTRSKTPSLVRVAEVPVISIGNLTTGGTGKTPFVIFVAKLLQAEGLKVAIVSRGYGARTTDSQNDEAMELAVRLPDVLHLQSADRWKMAQHAVTEFGSQVVILDDGFQHRQLHRDLDLVLVDCTNPLGYDRLLPRGLLREPIESLRRCHAIVLTRCELVSEQTKGAILSRITQFNPEAIIATVQTAASGWLTFDGTVYPLDHLIETPLLAFCGIGNPQNFLATLERLGMNVVKQVLFADHHHFSSGDFRCIVEAASSVEATALVCTHKDLVKVERNNLEGWPVYALQIDTEFNSNEEALAKLVRKAVSGTE